MHKYRLVRKKPRVTSIPSLILTYQQVACPSTRNLLFNRRYSSPRLPLSPPFVLSMKSIAFLRNWKKWATYRRDDEQANGRGYEPQKSVTVSPLSSISVKNSCKSLHYPLNWPYCSRKHPTNPPKNVTTDVFCAETPQDLPRTLLAALKALQNSVNLQFATSCLNCPHSYHIHRPTIYKSWFPPVRCPRKTSRILCHIRNLFPCYNP